MDADAVWARGSNYKARFASDGITFVPFFGSKATTNHPVHFALESARLGESSIEFDATATPRASGDAIDFARGPFVERWVLGDASIEQTFRIDALAPTGDLVLTLAVETDLQADTHGAALAFVCAFGRVEYGAAVAIDADGRRFPVARTWNDASIELRLERESIAGARFPIVLDPVVSTTSFDSSLADDFAPDTAYEASTNSYLVVYEEIFSAADHDVYALHLDAAGTPLFGGYLDYTTDDWRHPKVASNALAQNFMCVAAVTPVGGGQRRIRGATFAATTSTTGLQFTISGSESGDKSNPDVGGDPALVGPTYYMVVWQRMFSPTDHDIHARLMQADGTPASGLVPVDNSTATIDTVPAISKSDGNPPFATQVWTIAWQRFFFGTQEQIFGAQYRWDGALVNATFPIDLGDECLAPSVSSPLDGNAFYPREYMVAFQVKGQLQTQWDVLGAVFEGTQFQTGTDIGNYVNPSTNSSDQVHPRVDCDGRHFAVTWAQELAGGFNDWDIFVADLVYAAGYPFVVSWDTFAYTSFQELAPAITSTYSGGGARRRYLAAWDSLDPFTSGAAREVWTGLYDGEQGGFVTTFCAGDGTASACPCANYGASGNGCANAANAGGANLSSSGNPWVGNDTLTLHGSGMTNSAVLYFQGSAPVSFWNGAAFGNGLRCVTGFTVRLGVKFNVAGASQFPDVGDGPITSYLVIPSFGAQYFYQAWYRDDAGFCTGAGFNLTNGLRAIYAP